MSENSFGRVSKGGNIHQAGRIVSFATVVWEPVVTRVRRGFMTRKAENFARFSRALFSPPRRRDEAREGRDGRRERESKVSSAFGSNRARASERERRGRGKRGGSSRTRMEVGVDGDEEVAVDRELAASLERDVVDARAGGVDGGLQKGRGGEGRQRARRGTVEPSARESPRGS